MLGKRKKGKEEDGFEEMDSSGLGTAVCGMGSSASKRMTVPISVAASSADEVADDPSSLITNYEVFISFRGEDTRDNFTSHLYDALCRKKIKTFIDDRLNRGEEISSTLLKTIKRSEIFVIIFSKNYASSTWCLDELVKILECKERYGRLVIPIFYNVNPANVRRLTASYADSFVKHTKRFKNEMDKVYRWKDALTQASNLSGLDSTKIRPESELIRKIVKDILRKLKRNSSYDLKGLVGIHDHISAVESFLNIGSRDVRIVGIVGMGGIGKTTIADAVFHKLQLQFESCSFVLSVQEQLRTTGLDHIRNKYLQELLEEEDIGIHSLRSLFVKKIIQRKRILLVLDDINKSMQFEDLIRRDWFGQGSRIIITTRDMQVLRTANADEIYHVKEMSFDNAFQLFSTKAFKQGLPIKDYREFSEEAVNYCKGIPLALKVLGSFLYGRTKQDWENALKRLQKAPQKEILDVLKLSFDGLDDDLKDIFLDIAVFYDEKIKINVEELLNSCSFSADIGISILIDRSLISIWHGCFVVMHDLIRAMGREIVCQPTVYHPGTGRRLWKHEDIYHVLKKNKETDEIHGMCLDVSAIKEIYLRSDAFEKMENLKILKFYNPRDHCSSRLHIPNGLENLPEDLRFFQWDGYPHKFMPLNSCANNIVELNLCFSNVEQLWVGDQLLPNLKSIEFVGCNNLIRTPDLSMAPKIRHINLGYCRNLSQVYSSSPLHNLQFLMLNNCDVLKTVNIGGNKVDRRSWRLQADYEFFILYVPFILHKVCMRIFKSEISNSYNFHFNFVSVPVASMSESVDNDSAVLTLLHGALKSVLPNLEVLCLLDNPSSLGSLSKLLQLALSQSINLPTKVVKSSVMLTYVKLVEPTESLCSRGMKGTGNKGVVSSWDWEDLIDADDQNLREQSIYICDCRLSKIPSNNWRWECLTQVSLHKSDILTLPASIHSPTSLNSLLLFDYTWTQFTEFTLSLDSQTPDDVSKISFSLAEQRNLDHALAIALCSMDGRFKGLYCGNYNYRTPFNLHISLSLFFG